MLFAKSYIAQCEERHGVEAVETLLDACHALADLGVDRYKRPAKKSLAQEKARAEERAIEVQMQVNELWRTLPRMLETAQTETERRFPPEPQENLLYFLEKHAPLLAPWEREVVRMVRKIAQYFFPQRQTKVMNEGYATFWHYTILNEMRTRGLVGDGFMLEVLHSHTSVVYQPGHERAGPNMNPYALGFAIFRDIRRICESPTAEDRTWFPEIAGADWIDTVHFAMRHFRDESFIQQFLSPKVIRDFRLFLVEDDPGRPNMRVAAIHDDAGYRAVRSALARQYALAEHDPNIQVVSVDVAGDRSLTLEHFRNQGRPLTAEALEVMKHLSQLWGFDVKLRMSDPDGSLVEERVVQITPEMRRPTSGRGIAQLRARS
jgi:stage V sporulation protein R